MLTIGGRGKVIKVHSFSDPGVEKPDQDHVEATAEVQLQVSVHVGTGNVQVKDALEWWCMAGGLVDRLWPGDANFHGLGPSIGPGGTHWSNPWIPGEMQHPVEHVVLMAKVAGSASPFGPQERWVAGQFGIGADAATVWDGSVESAPDVLAASVPQLPIFVPPRTSSGPVLAQEAAIVPVFIAIETPANVVDLILPGDELRVQRTIYVQGQIVNWFKDLAVLDALKNPAAHAATQFQVKVSDAAGGVTVVDEFLFDGAQWLLTSGPGGTRGFTFQFDESVSFDDRVAFFILSLQVPHTFTLGHLEFVLTVNNHTFKRKVPVQLPAVDVLHCPLETPTAPDRFLSFGNGPGVSFFHTHNQDVRQRYALDVSVATHDHQTKPAGSPDQMESYFAFGLPVLCVADGVVRAVFDDSADDSIVHHPRTKRVPATPRGTDRVNRVFVEHEREGGRRYSVYAHIKKDSAKQASVVVGQRVKGGQKIAEVGWNGGSSEPHLHLAYYTLDSFGRYQALPMAFSLRSQTPGPSVIGVPMNGLLALPDRLPG